LTTQFENEPGLVAQQGGLPELSIAETRVEPAGAVKFPGDLVALPGQLRPARIFGRILLDPEPVVFLRERPQLRVPEPLRPRF
jgi:hypothetical protein